MQPHVTVLSASREAAWSEWCQKLYETVRAAGAA